MTQPLALVLYEELMPGSQLVNRLQDMHYRVEVISDPDLLSEYAQREGPMLVFTDLGRGKADICAIIAKIKQNQVTAHIPIIAFADEGTESLQATARQAGANVVATDAAVLAHLTQLIEQALHAD